MYIYLINIQKYCNVKVIHIFCYKTIFTQTLYKNKLKLNILTFEQEHQSFDLVLNANSKIISVYLSQIFTFLLRL